MSANDKAARRELVATIRALAHYHQQGTGRPISAEAIIASLRDLGQDEQANMLERMVVRIRAQRAS